MNTLSGYSKSTLTDNFVLTAAGGHLAVGNASNNIPLNNKKLNTDLNAEFLNGRNSSLYLHKSSYPTTSETNWNIPSGIYSTNANTEGLPYAYNGNLVIHANWNQNAANLIFLCYDKDYLAFRRKSGNVWEDWKQIAFTSDIPKVTDYYWANIKVKSTEDKTTIPTFGALNVTGDSYLKGLISTDGNVRLQNYRAVQGKKLDGTLVNMVHVSKEDVLTLSGVLPISLVNDTTVHGTLTTNKQIISKVAEGTAPISVISTTKVAGLNSDYLDGKHASAFMQFGSQAFVADVKLAKPDSYTRVCSIAENNSTGVSVLVNIRSHYNSTVHNATFLCTGTFYKNFGIISLGNPLYYPVKIRIGSSSTYANPLCIDIACSSQYCSDSTYYVYVLALQGNCVITKDGTLNVEACAYGTELSSTKTGEIIAPGFIKNGSDDTYVLLGGGGHTTLSQFALNSTLNNYLPLIGGKLTGKLQVNARVEIMGGQALEWTSGSPTVSCLLLPRKDDAYRLDYYNGTNWYKLAYKNDIPTKLSQLTDDVVVNNYLPITGGTLTGPLYINCAHDRKLFLNNSDGEKWSLISFLEKGEEYGLFGVLGDDVLRWNGYKIWHEGNDGDGSGLDADKLDGVHWYDLHKYIFKRHNYNILNTSSNLDNFTYANNSLGIYSSPDNTTITNSPILNFGLISMSLNTSYAGLLLLPYSASKNKTLYYRSLVHDGTSIVWGSWKKIAFTDTPVDEAKKLSTARKITLSGSVSGNTSFDGSADVTINTTISNAGTDKRPIYITGGVPTECAYALSASVDKLHAINPVSGGHVLYYYSGLPEATISKEGSNSYEYWSYPKGQTATSEGRGNTMNIRMLWSSKYLHDIYASPNYRNLWHRWINNGSANLWSRIVLEDNSNESDTWNISISGNAATTNRFLIKVNSKAADMNTALSGGGLAINYGYPMSHASGFTNAPENSSYGAVLELATQSRSLSGLLAWDVNHLGTDSTSRLWWRANDNTNFVNAKWHEIAFTDRSVKWGVNTTFESGTPASAVKSRFTASYMPHGNLLTYNTAGVEYTLLMTCRPDVLHGSALKWGYADPYIRILRFLNGASKTDDWEKISAGYADSSGDSDTLDGKHASDFAVNGHTHKTLYINGITNDVTYGTYMGIIQSPDNGPESGNWHNSIKILHNNSTGYYTLIAHNFTGSHGLWHRSMRSGKLSDWYRILDSNNYNSYAPKLDGTGATGTWNINISGDADTLDGFHAEDLYGYVSSSDLNNVIRSEGIAWTSYDYATSTSVINLPTGNNASDARGVITFWTGYPLLLSWRYNNAGSLYARTRYSGTWNAWNRIAMASEIPSVGNGTITINLAGSQIGTFTVNLSGNTTINLTDSNTTYSAGSGLALNGTTFKVQVPRISNSCNSLPGANSWKVEEYAAGTNYNLPSNHYYHIYTAEGPDTKYATQLALGMTTLQAYYRNYYGGSWNAWQSLINTDTNTWRGITDSYSGTDTTISLSQKGANTLYNALVNGYASSAGNADTVDGKHANAFVRNDLESDFDPSNVIGNYFGMSTKTGISSNWTHVICLDWRKGDSATVSGGANSSWATQLALPTQNRKGIYYRSFSSTAPYSWVGLIDSSNIGSQSVNYATSAGSASSAGSCTGNAKGLTSSGYGNGNFTYYQASSEFFGNSGWTHYLIANHGDGSNYYNYTIALPFWDVPKYKRLEGGTADGWHTFITSENIGSLSVNYASSAGSVAWGSITGKPSTFTPSSHTHSYITDAGNGTAIYAQYSSGGFTSNPSWLAAWSGYKITYVSPSNVSVGYASSAGSVAWSNVTGKPTIPTVSSRSLTVNGTAYTFYSNTTTAAASFYAPTSVGTSGYILKSNGSGAPVWDKRLSYSYPGVIWIGYIYRSLRTYTTWYASTLAGSATVTMYISSPSSSNNYHVALQSSTHTIIGGMCSIQAQFNAGKDGGQTTEGPLYAYSTVDVSKIEEAGPDVLVSSVYSGRFYIKAMRASDANNSSYYFDGLAFTGAGKDTNSLPLARINVILFGY